MPERKMKVPIPIPTPTPTVAPSDRFPELKAVGVVAEVDVESGDVKLGVAKGDNAVEEGVVTMSVE